MVLFSSSEMETSVVKWSTDVVDWSYKCSEVEMKCSWVKCSEGFLGSWYRESLISIK